YAVERAIERDRTRWLVLAGLLLGFAFLTKMMQAFLVLPGFGIAYLWAGPARLRRRLWQLLAGLGGVIVGAGWWIAIAELTPAADRPYFGGSTNNNILELALGYNGLGRLDGSETGSIGGGGGGGGSAFGGATGPLRLFQSEFGGQVSWLIPAALLSLAALVWVSWRAPRTSRARAFALLWGGWLLVTGLVFSFMQGIIHPYYMVALAPAIGALVGVGAIALLRSDTPVAGRAVAAAGILGTGVWAYVLLDRTPTWLPWLRWTVLLAGLLGAAAVFVVPALTGRAVRRGDGARPAARLAYAPLALALVAGLGGPLAYSLDTANTTHTGSIPSAGPTVAGAFGGPGGNGGPGTGARTGTGGPFGGTGTGTGNRTGTGNATGGVPGGSTNGTGGGTAPSGAGGFPSGTGTGSTGTGSAGTGTGGRTGAPTAGAGAGGTPGAGGGMGGLSGSTQVSSALTKLLEQNASQYKWIAATEGSQSAAPIELATGGDAVMAIGGFNGTDPTPTLAQFEAMVAKNEIHYYVGQSNNSFGGGRGSSAITSWVAAHFKSETVGGVTVYNLTEQK
ncbi:MAG TPA: glycosyltransferase family 39 protein, partial [Trebonia sp.]|nr:glycosyltransferase family 39 protein [Trebonia sp.]